MRGKLQAALLAGIAAVAIAACGSSSSSSSTSASGGGGATNAAASTGSATKSPILIGQVVSGAGSPVFSEPQDVSAVSARIRAINAAGGLDGHPLKLDYCNDKNDPNTTISCAQKMISDHVVMLDGGGDLTGAQLVTIMNKAGIPEVGFDAYTGAELNSPNMFLLTSTAPGYVVAMGYLAAHHYKVSMIGADNATALQLYAGLGAATASLKNPWISKTLVPTTVPDLSPYVQSAVKGNPTAIQSFLGTPTDYQAMVGVEKSAPGTKWVSAAANVSSVAEATANGTAAIMQDAITFGNLLPLQDKSNPLISQFWSEMASYQKATGDQYAAPSQQSFGTFSAWLGLWVVQQLVKNGQLSADNMSAATVMKAFQTAKNINMEGVTPPWTPNAPGPTGETRISDQYYYLWTYTDGGATVKLLTPHAVNAVEALEGKF
jgi:ABC-type branched-subunit amino acid transport system substrate-binding protein